MRCLDFYYTFGGSAALPPQKKIPKITLKNEGHLLRNHLPQEMIPQVTLDVSQSVLDADDVNTMHKMVVRVPTQRLISKRVTDVFFDIIHVTGIARKFRENRFKVDMLCLLQKNI